MTRAKLARLEADLRAAERAHENAWRSVPHSQRRAATGGKTGYRAFSAFRSPELQALFIVAGRLSERVRDEKISRSGRRGSLRVTRARRRLRAAAKAFRRG